MKTRASDGICAVMSEVLRKTDVAKRESPLTRLGARGPRKLFEAFDNRDECVAEICERLSLGEPLAVICRESPHLPDSQTLWEWEKQDAAIDGAIARARRLGHHVIATDLLKTARGDEGYSTGDVARDKLIADTSLKLLAKWDPRYAESQQLRHADAEGGKLDTAPLVTEMLGMLAGGAAPQLLDVTPRLVTGDSQSAIPNAQPALRAFDVGYRPRAKRLQPKPDVDDLV